MKLIFLLLISVALTPILKAQTENEYDLRTEQLAKEISHSIDTTRNLRICLIYVKKSDGTTSNLCELLSKDISHELAKLSSKQAKFTVVNSDNINAKLNSKKIKIQSDLMNNIKKQGNDLGGAKMYLSKSKDLEKLNEVAANTPPISEEKKKPKRENKFWKSLGEMATSTITTTATGYIDKALNGKSSQSGSSHDTASNPYSNSTSNQYSGTQNNNTTNECATNETGNICFTNNSPYNLTIVLYKPSSYTYNGIEPTNFEITVTVGEKDCMYNVGKGNYTYIARESQNRINPVTGAPAYEKRSTVYITACKEWDISLR